MGSTRARSVPAAQSTSKKLPAREVIGQPSPAPRRSCPKQAGKHHRGRSNWAAKSSTAAELPKTSRKISPRGSLMGSQVQHRGKAAQSKPESTTAREFNGQPSPAPRQSCPKQAGKYHRGRSNWEAQEPEVYRLPKVRAKNFPRGSLLGSKVQHRGGAAQNKPEDITARKLMGSQVQHRGGAAQNKPESTTAREVNGQQSSTPRQSCPN